MNPKVFVSHASEDKERFVLDFATKLRNCGIDAWVDKWEMYPGDSLVDKIFEEGIKSASAVIVVLSKFSVAKPWVQEELNAAFVRKVNGSSRLIPIVIEDCEVPEALKSTLWEHIKDISSYDASFERILASICGASDKPALGNLPNYVKAFASPIGGLTNMDSLVLRLACELALDGNEGLLQSTQINEHNEGRAIPEGELLESLEILDQEGYVSVIRLIGGGVVPFNVTTFGFNAYAETCIPEYPKKIAAIASMIVNEGESDNINIARHLSEKQFMVDKILELLQINGHIKISNFLGGLTRVYEISPSLKRALRE